MARMDLAMIWRSWGIGLKRTVRKLQSFARIEQEDKLPPQERGHVHSVFWLSGTGATGSG
jgi:hypothetical protein